jgi:hypothetical protein
MRDTPEHLLPPAANQFSPVPRNVEAGMLAYAVVLLTMITGALHAGWWCGAIGGVTLGLLSLAEQRHLRPRFAANDNLAILNPTSALAASVHCALGAAAYPIGHLIQLFAP